MKENPKKAQNQERKKQKPTKKERIQQKRKKKLQILKQKKQEVTTQLTAAQTSTKSMGKFDKKAHQNQRKLKPKRRKNHANFSNIDSQIQRNKQMYQMIKSQGMKKLQHSL